MERRSKKRAAKAREDRWVSGKEEGRERREKKEEREREGEGNQMHAQFNRFPEDPLNAALKASATNRSNL